MVETRSARVVIKATATQPPGMGSFEPWSALLMYILSDQSVNEQEGISPSTQIDEGGPSFCFV